MTNYYNVLDEVYRIYENYIGEYEKFDHIYEDVFDPIFSEYFGRQWDSLNPEDKWCEAEERLFETLTEDKKIELLNKVIDGSIKLVQDMLCPIGPISPNDEILEYVIKKYNALRNRFLGTNVQPADNWYETLDEEYDDIDFDGDE